MAEVHKPVTSTDDDTEKSEPSYTAGGNIKQSSHFRKLSGVPQMIKYWITIQPGSETETQEKQKYVSTPTVYTKGHSGTGQNNQKWKQPKGPTGEWINMWSIRTMGYYSAKKKMTELLLVTKWVKLKNILTEKSQT